MSRSIIEAATWLFDYPGMSIWHPLPRQTTPVVSVQSGMYSKQCSCISVLLPLQPVDLEMKYLYVDR